VDCGLVQTDLRRLLNPFIKHVPRDHVWGLRQAGDSCGIPEEWRGVMPSSRGHRAESQPQQAALYHQWISFSHMSRPVMNFIHLVVTAALLM
jgi:hypothetical protein